MKCLKFRKSETLKSENPKFRTAAPLALLAIISGFQFFSVSALAANLIPNSSFECGVGRGWLNYGTSDNSFLGNAFETRSLLTNDAFHGRYSLNVKGVIYTRGIYLYAGTYTFSLYAKCSSPGAGPLFFGILDGANLYNTAPPSTANIASTWTRYTSPFTASSNGFYWGKIYTFQTANFQIDALQLETSASATAYAPQATIEAGLSIDSSNAVWFAGGAVPSFTLNFRNEGGAITAQTEYNVFDAWNANVLTGQNTSALAAATNTAVVVTLPSNRTGWFRVKSRLLTVNDSDDEATLVVYPFASNTVAVASTDWLGGHPHASAFHVQREMMVGRRWGRVLSPDYAGTRWDYIEPTRGAFTFNDYAITNLFYGGMTILVPLTPSDGFWPTWSTNADGTIDLNSFSNYCNKVVGRYKTFVSYWEIGPNEPFQSGPLTPLNLQLATNYAKVLEAGIRGVTNADPTAKIIAIAGAFGNGDWAMDVWTNISASSRAAIFAVSTHIYPQDNATDPNAAEDAASHFSNPGDWIIRFGSICPVWNTESGTYSVGPIKGLNGIWPIAYDIQQTLSPEAWRSESENRQLASLVRILTEGLRCIGYGMSKYFYYDSRMFNDASFQSTQPYPADYLQVDRPEIVSLSVAQSVVRRGFGRVINASAPTIEMYSFTNSIGNPVIAAWNYDRVNRSLSLGSSAFGVLDAMGNSIQTNLAVARICRVPEYFVSSSLTLAQLSNTLASATVASAADVLAPRTSFDIAPSGNWSGATNAALVKWTSLDDTSTAWPPNANATNVSYKWKLDGGSYSPYSQSNHVWFSNLSAGNHTVYVTATDATGNAAETSYTFGQVVVPPPPVTQGQARHSTKRKPF